MLRTIELSTRLESRIDTVEVTSDVRRGIPASHLGPWAFRFDIPPRPAADRMLAALTR
jgi:hypothetical protein